MSVGRRLLGLVACVAALGFVAAASAQEFPSRPMKIVVGFGPGGLGDVTARSVGQKMSASLGKSVIVENMPGAGGMTAAASVARAAPDGHTILLFTSQNAISPSMFKSIPYDWRTDFTPVSMAGVFNFVLIVDKNSPLKTVGDLIALAKADPSKVNIGTISVGSAQNLAALLFSSKAGLSVPTVPFRTTGEVVTALAGGQIQAAFETVPGVLGQLQSGTLRALGVSSDKRESFLPGVPTIAEGGVAGYNVSSFNGFAVAAKTPSDIVMTLHREIVAAVADPEIRQRFISLGIDPRTTTPEAFKTMYEADVIQWRKVITDANIAPQ